MASSISYWQVFKSSKNFRLISLALALSLFGDWVGLLAVFSLLSAGESSVSAEFSILLVIKQLPIVLFSVLGGSLADSFSRKKLMIVSDLVRAVVMLALILTRDPMTIYLLVFIQSMFSAVFEPSRSALIPRLVNADALPSANGATSLIWSTMLVSGAAIGGVIIEIAGPVGCLILDSASYIASAYLIKKIDLADNQVQTFTPKTQVDSALSLFKDKKLLLIMTLKGIYGLGAAMYLILAVLGREKFTLGESGSVGISVLYMCRGGGALLGPLLSLRYIGAAPKVVPKMILIGFLMISSGYCGVAWASSLFLTGLFTILGHAGGSLLWVYSTTLLQRETTDEIRGRASGIEMTGFFASSTLSQVVFGALMGSHTITPENAAFLCACIWVGCFFFYATAFKRIGIKT